MRVRTAQCYARGEIKYWVLLLLPFIFTAGFICFSFPDNALAEGVESPSQISLKSGSLPIYSLDRQIDYVKGKSETKKLINQLIQSGMTVTRKGILRRSYTMDQLIASKTQIDSRAFQLSKGAKSTFALAISDANLTGTLVDWLPLAAAAYRLAGKSTLKDWLVTQLSELSGWDSLQRPGWTLANPPGTTLPAGGDGSWLASGWGIRAIADALEILPKGMISADLRSKLEGLLIREINRITEDWRTEKQWFVKNHAVTSNQWVLPTTGLIRACIVVGRNRFQNSYELGVSNIVKTLDSLGENGEWDEGLAYAVMTLPEILHTARAMATAGDERLIKHQFLRNVSTWLIHHSQPGKRLINAFDSSMNSTGEYAAASGQLRELFSLLVIAQRDPVARWALWRQFGGPRPTVAGIGATLIGPSDTSPVAWGVYERATRVNWRSSWKDGASGIWVRGGHEKDSHDHYDRGHVNYILDGKPILIEAGTPDYGHPLIEKDFKSVRGHNVLEVESKESLRKPARITVRSLGKGGGDLRIDASLCYPSLKRWTRDVEFAKERLLVNDEVIVKDGKRENLIFRWHLGSPRQVALNGSNRDFVVSWGNTTTLIHANTEITLDQYIAEDRTLKRPEQVSNHAVLEVRSKNPVSRLTVTTEIRKSVK